MKNIFIKKEKRPYITVSIYYVIFEKNNLIDNYYFFSEILIPEKLKHKTKKIKAKFLIPTFEEHSNIKNKSTSFSKEGYTFRDENLYQEKILQYLLKRIITDEEEVEINEENYTELHPNLADALYRSFYNTFLQPDINNEDVKD